MHLRRAFTLVELLVVIAILGALVALLLPAINAAREGGRCVRCQTNLKQVSLAILGYANAHANHLPPLQHGVQIGKYHGSAYGAYSWRASVLPFMEEQEFYDQLDSAKPPDEPQNAMVVKSIISVFQCPSTPGSPRTVMTYGRDLPTWDSPTQTFSAPELPAGANDYVAISEVRTNESSGLFWGTDYGVGAWLSRPITSRSHFSVLSEQARRNRVDLLFTLQTRGASLAKIEDGLSNTLLVGERGGLEDFVCSWCGEVFRAGTWALPNDIGSYQCMYEDAYFHCHDFFVHRHVAMCDGSVHSLSHDIDDNTVWALVTRAGNEVTAKDW